MTEDEKSRVKSDVIEAMRIAIEDSLSPVAHVPGNMAIAYKAAEAGFAAGLETLSGPPEPSEEEVGETIGYYFGTLVSRNPQPDMSGDPRAKLQPHIRRQFDSAAREAARAVLALFRSRING